MTQKQNRNRHLIVLTTELHPTAAQNAQLHAMEAQCRCLRADHLASVGAGVGSSRPPAPEMGMAHSSLPQPVMDGIRSQVRTALARSTDVPMYDTVHVPLDEAVQAIRENAVTIEGITDPVVCDLWLLPLGLAQALRNGVERAQTVLEEQLAPARNAVVHGYLAALDELDALHRRHRHLLTTVADVRGAPADAPHRVGHATLRRVVRPDGVSTWVIDWSVRVPDGWLPRADTDDVVGVDVGMRNVVSWASAHGQGQIGRAALLYGGYDPALHPLTNSSLRREFFRAHEDEVNVALRSLLRYRVIAVEGMNWAHLAQTNRSAVQAMQCSGAAHLHGWLQALSPLSDSCVVAVPARGSSQRCARCGQKGAAYAGLFSCDHCGSTLDSDLNAASNHRQRAVAMTAR